MLKYPIRQGLYHPENEHDACGVGFVVRITGERTHDIVERGLQVLENMDHRGAAGADRKTGDGAGILVQIPHEFILLQGIPVPERGHYGTGLVFFPKAVSEARLCMELLESALAAEDLKLLAVRDVPVNSSILGEISRSNEPVIRQLFVTGSHKPEVLERKLYRARKQVEHAAAQSTLSEKRNFYIVSLSTQRMIYKGMLGSMQLRPYFPDLSHPNFTSSIALAHARFSTNTFPTWDLAQPFRLLGHNGEINTIKGNRFWMQAREAGLLSEVLGSLEELFPILQPGMSDSGSLDNMLEFLVLSGMPLPQALSILVPDAWNDKNPIPDELKAFYEYYSIMMEPWDGPATLLFSDGRYVGGTLDRNGLRPARYVITTDEVMIVASEVGVQNIPAEQIREKGRLKPGKMLLVDTQEHRVQYDAELKHEMAVAKPYRQWLNKNRVRLEDLSSGREVKHTIPNLSQWMKVFGYGKEDVERIIAPMALEGKEPISSMGNDTPLAVFSDQPQRLYAYFRQLFAQVTNPPIDPIREELVMSLTGFIGSYQSNLLKPSPDHCKVVKLKNPVVNNRAFDLLKNLRYKGFSSVELPMLFPVKGGEKALEKAVNALCVKAEEAVENGHNYLVLTDRGMNADMVPIPALLAVSAVHHHLIECRKRMQIDIVVESAEPREVMHFALLFGYGANVINPYGVFAVIDDLVARKEIQSDYATAEKHYIKSVEKGLLKVLSKMGISTLRSYRGAQIFEAVGISSAVLERYFSGTQSKIEGIDLEDLARDAMYMHHQAFDPDASLDLEHAGLYAWRKDGEFHAWNPESISRLQIATKTGSYEKFKEYVACVDDKSHPIFLRDFLSIKQGKSIDISEVEPASEIMKRFVTGAMSYGSISKEAHEAMAIAMNIIGGKSNTGEGGEDPERFVPRADGTSARSAIKQVASGRFGVTTEYLVHADEIQIKVAQGAKPGEGGQLPGYKVDEVIAKTRHSIPGISLISPPPHHDIYSIEDLAQLIFDLKNVNPLARISVKLVSESGVGTVAAGVAKAKADMILISGCEGGTGASPSSSIRHAGLPVEIGLAETQQTLLMNGLRGQVRLQTDGQLKTGRDIILSALLGAEEFGFATSALIVLGCVMMRKCHMNTCPVGVATQNEALRKRFIGRYSYLVNFFNFLAEDVRSHLAAMGYRKLDDIVGKVNLIQYSPKANNVKMGKINLSKLIHVPESVSKTTLRQSKLQSHDLEHVLDQTLIKWSMPALEMQSPVQFSTDVCNTDRSVGAMLSGNVAKRYGNAGLPSDTIRATFRGSAGQSFAAFLSKGVTFRLEGDANDYLGKGLSGGKVIVVPPKGSHYTPHDNCIAGNTLLYGATSGEVYINGQVGERFCVRNSGAIAVVEGVGDHCCEYMTGGRTVVLGKTGRNFAAGMSGGIAYVLDEAGDFDYFCNMQMVELSLIEDMADNRELKNLIEAHHRYTQSPKAAHILANWASYVDRFIRVIPIEYKKVLHDEKLEAVKKKIAQVEYDY